MYGFLFTIGLPEYLKIPVIYPSQINWQQVTPGTLIVATPFQWQLLVNSLPNNLCNIQGVTAASPMYQDLYNQISSKNIVLTEIYGSTETAGVGFRKNCQEPFKLFPYWQIKDINGSFELEDRDTQKPYPLMDNIYQFSNQTFSILGRKDQQIKIAGHLVNLDNLKKSIQKLSNICECTISAKSESNEIIIYANLKLNNDNEAERLNIKQEIRNLLPAQEQPRIIYFT
jgi:acyl-coenzyme A synthetase/AMP-(fatty) acid ligase